MASTDRGKRGELRYTPSSALDLRGDVRLDAPSVAEEGNEDPLRSPALETSGIDAASTSPRASVRGAARRAAG